MDKIKHPFSNTSYRKYIFITQCLWMDNGLLLIQMTSHWCNTYFSARHLKRLMCASCVPHICLWNKCKLLMRKEFSHCIGRISDVRNIKLPWSSYTACLVLMVSGNFIQPVTDWMMSQFTHSANVSKLGNPEQLLYLVSKRRWNFSPLHVPPFSPHNYNLQCNI